MSDSYLLQFAVPNCTASRLHCVLIETRLSPRYLEVAAERERNGSRSQDKGSS